MTEISQANSDHWECRVVVGEESGDVWALEQGDTGDDLPDDYTIWTMVPKSEADRLRAENDRLRESLQEIADGYERHNPGWWIKKAKAALAPSYDETGARPHDAEGRPLCFVCRRTQSEHEGGVECSAPSPRQELTNEETS